MEGKAALKQQKFKKASDVDEWQKVMRFMSSEESDMEDDQEVLKVQSAVPEEPGENMFCNLDVEAAKFKRLHS